MESLTIDFRGDTQHLDRKIAEARIKLLELKATIIGTFKALPKAIGNAFAGLFNLLRDGLKGILIALAIAFALSICKIFTFIREAVLEAIPLNQQLADKWESLKFTAIELKAAIGNMFLPLLEAAIPAIQKTLTWLIELFNKVAQITAAFMGQKTVLQVIPGSAEKLAKSTEKVKKAAQGALAAFDQIDILARKTTEDTGAGTTPSVLTEQVPIDPKWLTLVDNLKAMFTSAIEAIKNAWLKFVEVWNAFWASPIGELLQALWENFVNTLKKLWANAIDTFNAIKAGVQRIFKGISEIVTGVLAGDWRRVWEGMKDIAGGVLDIIVAIVQGDLKAIQILFEGLKNGATLIFNALLPVWQTVWNTIQAIGVGVINVLRGAWADFSNWFRQVVIDPLRNNFANAWDFIKDKFNNAFSGIGNIARAAFNGLVDVINGILQRIAQAINGMANITNPFSWMFGWSIPTVSAPHIPHLATGAVVPPHSNMLAMIGEGSQKEVVAPDETIRRIIREELGNSGELTAMTPIVLQLDGEVIYKNQERIRIRRGKSLVAGGTI